MAKRGMAMGAINKLNIGTGRKAGLSLSGKGLGTSPFSQSSSGASKSVRKVNSEIKSKLAKRKKKGMLNMGVQTNRTKPGMQPNKSKPTGSTQEAPAISKEKRKVMETQRAKKRLGRRLSNYNTGIDSIIPFTYTSNIEFAEERDSEWRRNLSLSLKRYWARKKPGNLQGNIPEIKDADRRYKAGESGTSILLDPNISGKTKSEIIGTKIGGLTGRVDVAIDHVRDRVKDVKRGFRGKRRDIKYRNLADKYNADILVPAIGAAGLGINTLASLRGTGLKTNLVNKFKNRKNLNPMGLISMDPQVKLRKGTRLAALGAVGLGAVTAAKEMQRRKEQKQFEGPFQKRFY